MVGELCQKRALKSGLKANDAPPGLKPASILPAFRGGCPPRLPPFQVFPLIDACSGLALISRFPPEPGMCGGLRCSRRVPPTPSLGRSMLVSLVYGKSMSATYFRKKSWPQISLR